ncbi:hypothetical protein Nepgr_006792 [Nepenthes gracilis]|uniref:Uncharacterized protein n=1 Tax=Nepenthes gracilis TaxID=150966 RepID=A0AAD3S6I0_NEPGR|nr:hypothetical protein Nepgr_006792 [Nepenthes gracilis]
MPSQLGPADGPAPVLADSGLRVLAAPGAVGVLELWPMAFFDSLITRVLWFVVTPWKCDDVVALNNSNCSSPISSHAENLSKTGPKFTHSHRQEQLQHHQPARKNQPGLAQQLPDTYIHQQLNFHHHKCCTHTHTSSPKKLRTALKLGAAAVHSSKLDRSKPNQLWAHAIIAHQPTETSNFNRDQPQGATGLLCSSKTEGCSRITIAPNKPEHQLQLGITTSAPAKTTGFALLHPVSRRKQLSSFTGHIQQTSTWHSNCQQQ